MGCCQSRGQKRNTTSDERPSVVHIESLPTTTSASSANLEISASRAAWAAESNFGDYTKFVEIRDRVLFAYLFDPHSTQEAAAFCSQRCPDVFRTQLRKCDEDVREALTCTVLELDHQFLKSSQYSQHVGQRRFLGEGTFVVDLENQRCWIANTGATGCIIGKAEGAFNSKYMDGQSLVHRHDTGNPVEQKSLKERFSQDVLQTVDGLAAVKGITKLTRCVGYGFAKDPKLATAYNKETANAVRPLPNPQNPYIVPNPHVEECDLNRGVEKIILCSEGMTQLLSPAEMAIFAMHFEKGNLSQLAEMHLQEMNPVEMTPVYYSPSVALVRHAVRKAAENLGALMNAVHKSLHRSEPGQKRFELVGLEDIQRLKVKPAEAQATPKIGSFCRRDVHGNLSCVVISVESQERARRLFAKPSRSNSIPPIVLHRWKLVQLYVKYHIQRRRTCLRRWWQLIASVVHHAQQQLLNHEKADWLRAQESSEVLTDTSSSSSDKNDVSTEQAAFPTKISSGFRKWLDATSRKGKVGSMNEAEMAAKVLCL